MCKNFNFFVDIKRRAKCCSAWLKPHRDDQGVVGMGEAQGSCVQGELVSVQVRNRELFVVPTDERGDRSEEGGVPIPPLAVLSYRALFHKV